MISVENVVDTTIIGSYTQCPRCGGPAKGVEGRLTTIDGGAFVLHAGPKWSWDLLDELRGTLRRVIDERPTDPVAAIAETSPEVAAQIEQVSKGWSLELKFALILALHQVLTADYSNVNALAAAVRWVLQYYAEHGPHGLR